MARGRLRIYLGAAPGVGKTFAMLNEGWRRHERGSADIVVGFVETHGRANTAAQLHDLEIVPRKKLHYRDLTFEEMDVDAILARKPQVALVDELAHTNVPGSRNEKRWQDVEELLEAGIEVISTVNVQHLESMNDVIEAITGIEQQETIPDAVVRSADQIELVDMSPEALRRRMAHGNIYPPERVDTALSNYFREGNLGALRELALMWVADRVDEALERYRETHGITRTWETRERVVVAITGAPGGEAAIRRAARMAARTKSELIGVYVRSSDGLADSGSTEGLVSQRHLLDELGAKYHELASGDVAGALVRFARGENATQIVLGATQRSRLMELVARFGDQRRDPRVRSDRRPRHLDRRSGDGSSEEADPSGTRSGTVTPAPRRRVDPGRRRPDPADGRAHRDARPGEPPDGSPPVPAPHRGGGGDRWLLARIPGCGRGLPARQLVLHPAAAHADDRRRRQPRIAHRVRRDRRGGELTRQCGGPPDAGSRPGPGPRRNPCRPERRGCRELATRSRSSLPSSATCSRPTPSPSSTRATTARGSPRPSPASRRRPDPRTGRSRSRCDRGRSSW